MTAARPRRLSLKGLRVSGRTGDRALIAWLDERRPASSRTVPVDDTVEKLAWLAKLLDEGRLTAREFELAETRVLLRRPPSVATRG